MKGVPTFCYVVTTRGDLGMLVMTHVAMLTLRRIVSGARVVLVVDEPTASFIRSSYPVLAGAVDDLQVVPTGIDDGAASSRYVKTRLRSSVAGDFVFLDVDTLVLRDISALWTHGSDLCGVLDDNSLASGVDAKLVERFRKMGWPEPRGPYLNSGVLFWTDNAASRALGDLWYTRWQESRRVMGDTDQPALHCAMIELGVTPTVLPQGYNQKVRDKPQGLRDPAVLHYTTRSALNDRHLLIYHLIEHLRATGKLDERALERAQRRNDPWISAGPGVRGNLATGRYWAALREGVGRALGRGGAVGVSKD